MNQHILKLTKHWKNYVWINPPVTFSRSKMIQNGKMCLWSSDGMTDITEIMLG
jgi:hypothetical protein